MYYVGMKRREETAIIKITKVFYDDEPSHWECDVYAHDTIEMGGGTAPTFTGVYDMAYDLIAGGYDYEVDHNDWVNFDANKR